MRELFKDFELTDLSLESVLDDTKRLDALHYAETETKYKKTPLQPNYENMVAAERRGAVAYFSAFCKNALVGHVFYYVSKSDHSDSLNAVEDRYFIVEEHRGSGLARRLLKFAEYGLKARGATDIFMSSKSPLGGPKIDPLLVDEGYAHVANVFHKAMT